MRDLEGKTAVVTGSTAGIGLETAKALLERGANVMFHGVFLGDKAEEQRSAFSLELKQMMDAHPQQTFGFHECDVRNADEVQAMMDNAANLLSKDGAIDIVVNNAGIQIAKPLGVISPEEYSRLIDINLKGVFNGMHAALPYLEKSKDASIINIGSVHSHVGSPGREAYCSAKFALDGLTRSASVELAKKGNGIRVNLVCPAFVDTALAHQGIDNRMESHGISRDEAEAWRLGLQDGKWISMDELTGTIGDIASGAHGYKTGASVMLDNGYVDKANTRSDGIAYFERADEMAVERLNRQIAERELDQGRS